MNAAPARPPSGTQHEIVRGAQRAVVTEVGAALRHYSVGGDDVLDGFGEHELAPAGRGQVLAPWPNRLDRGTYTFEGVEAKAALDEPERRNAIHGLVRWLSWTMVSRSDDAIELGCSFTPHPGYPWFLELGLGYRLTDEGLTVSVRAENGSDTPAPFGLGFHPYLSIGGPVDDAVVAIPATRRLVTDDRGLPIGEEPVSGTPFDFGDSRPLGAMRLDTGYTGLLRDADGIVRATVDSPDGDRNLTVWADERFHYLMVYTGDTLEPVPRRRQGIAVEPMTCPPNAFATGRDVHRLVPGEPWRARWGIGAGRRQEGARV